MPATPSTRWAIQRPADGDFINAWPASMRATIDAIDALMAGINFTDPRPAPGIPGRFHRHPVTGVVSLDTGPGWIEMARLPHASAHAEGGADPVAGQVPIGGVIAYTGGALPSGTEWAWADGGLIDKTTFATFFTRTGHVYNGGVDPGANKVRLPDKRGRVPMGADNFGSGAASRIVTAAAGRGQNGGSERVQLASSESGLPAHGHSQPSHAHSAGTDSQLNDMFAAEVPGLATLNSNSTVVTSGGFNGPIATNSNPWSTYFASHGHGVTVNGTTPGNVNNNSAAGAGASHQNLQPYEADTYIVRIS